MPHQVDGALDRSEGGQDDDRCARHLEKKLTQKLPPAHARHVQVRDDRREGGGLGGRERRFAVRGDDDAVACAFENLLDEPARGVLVVDDEQGRTVLRAPRRLRRLAPRRFLQLSVLLLGAHPFSFVRVFRPTVKTAASAAAGADRRRAQIGERTVEQSYLRAVCVRSVRLNPGVGHSDRGHA